MRAPLRLPFLLLTLPLGLAACSGDDKDQNDDGTVDPSDGGEGEGGDGTAADDGGDGAVEPAIPTTLLIEAPADAEIGEWAPVTATVLDQNGAPLDLEVTLSVESDAAIVDPAEGVQFGADGVYVVVGTLAAGDDHPELTASSEPITVDSNGPVIRVDAPSSASWFDPTVARGPLRLMGQITDPIHPIGGATLNGEPIVLDADGNFDVELPSDFRLMRLDIVAEDTDGNAADRVLGFAQGPTLPLDAAINPAVALNISEGGLLVLADGATATITPDAMQRELIAANPLFTAAVPGVGLLRMDGRTVSWDNLSIGARLGEGSLGLDLTITNLYITVDQRLTTLGGEIRSSGAFSDTSTTLSLEMALSAPTPGDALVVVTDSALEFTAASYNASGFPVPSTLDVGAIVGPLILPIVTEATRSAVEAALEALVLDAPLNVMGTVIGFEGEFNEIAMHPAGLSVIFDGVVTGPAADPSVPEAPGSLRSGGAPPAAGSVLSDLDFSLGSDLVNRIVHLAYQSGAFNIALSATELGIAPALIDLVFPGATTLDLDLQARLPPALRPASGSFAFDLVEMDLRATGLVSGASAPVELTHAALHLTAPVTVSTDGSGAIIADIGDPEVIIDVLDVDAGGVAAAEALEDRLSSLAAVFVGDLLPDLEVFAPEVPGFVLTTDSVAAGGEALDWMTAACSVD